jgi:hypothetical protein
MIDEMIPARYRGRVDIGINGTYWAGAILGTVGALLFLNALSPSVGWRIGFLLGSRPGRRHRVRATTPAREPPLAAHAWPRS